MLINEETRQRLLDLPVEEVAEALGIEVRRHQALCFMHDDHHPSLALMPSRNRWKCFVCDKGGNNIDLVQQYLGLDFIDSCRWLGSHFGIEIEGNMTSAIKVLPRVRPAAKAVTEVTVDREMLQTLADGLRLTWRARRFLCEERRYSPEVVQRLKLCAAETDNDIIKVLSAHYPEQRIVDSGLAYKLRNGQWRTYFNTPCLFFPYYDEEGRLLTLQARYLGNPEEHQRFQFPRGSQTCIFNLPILPTLQADEPLYISEGVTDCIALLSSGKKAIAIPSASALKPAQLLAVVSHPLCMYPDHDEPGERLYSQLQELVTRHDGQITRLELPDGCKDYSVCYRQQLEQRDREHGSDATGIKQLPYSLSDLLSSVGEVTYEYLFFWGHKSRSEKVTRACLSQWYACHFEVDGITYNCAEQYMMAEKARAFGDEESRQQILQADDPSVIKQLGRQVSNFDAKIWAALSYDVVKRGNLAKFSQNPSLLSFLRWTAGKILVEASPYDRIWGIGMKECPDASDPRHWNGSNKLGFALIEVREQLMHGSEA